MKITKTTSAIAICCLGSLSAINVGHAALTQIAVSANSGVSGLNITAYSTSQGNNTTTWAGNWNATITGGFIPSGAPAINTTWQSFCMDLGNSMGNSTYNYTAKSFSAGDPPANDPPDPKWVAGGGSKAGYLYGLHLGALTGNATQIAIARSALAISIWEVLYESGATYSVSSHNATKGFEVVGSGAASTGLGIGSDANQAIWLANSWLNLAMADGFANAPSSTWWMEDSTLDAQSLIGVPTMVPEPGTYVAGLLLVLPFAASTIRRKFKVS
jgi:hypothetical protein